LVYPYPSSCRPVPCYVDCPSCPSAAFSKLRLEDLFFFTCFNFFSVLFLFTTKAFTQTSSNHKSVAVFPISLFKYQNHSLIKS
jgi:hypothetical protein